MLHQEYIFLKNFIFFLSTEQCVIKYTLGKYWFIIHVINLNLGSFGQLISLTCLHYRPWNPLVKY